MRPEREGRPDQPERVGTRRVAGYPETAGSLLAERIRSDEESGSGMEGELMGEPPAYEI